MDEQFLKLMRAVQAALFIYGEEISEEKIANALKIDNAKTKELLRSLEEELSRDTQGLALLRTGEKVRLITKPELAPYLLDLAKEEFTEELSKASIETLAIVAYLGPISRAEVDYIRGVNSTFILRSLLLRKLVDRSPSAGRPGVMVYEVSGDAMRHMGLLRLEELPEYEKYRELLKFLRKNEQ